MKERINVQKAAPGAVQAMLGLENYIAHCGLERPLIHLVKKRASQINGCAYCIDMHSKDARATGESEQRLYELNAWRETPFYTECERAALLWTEELTLISQGHAPDAVYEEVHQHFSEEELVNFTLLTVRGRKSGKPIETPIAIFVQGGKSYLITPYGIVNWVRNLRAAGGEATITHTRRTEKIRAVELPPEAAAPIFREAVLSGP